MNALPIRRLAARILTIVIIFTILGMVWQQPAFVRGVWLALGWQAASLTCLAVAARILRQPASTGRAWRLTGIACLKFPVLYTAGYWLLRRVEPGALGLALGMTIPWLVLTACAAASLMKPAQPSAAGSA